ncbi:hypothetical protein ASPCADRAFT_131324 [Aspergillus carbonarius ITEM 5010]|uniref:Uncharacterized protein n=1 Tax=Aspergillus carbonarius (strain ITEM 5010) TaxID=602072 RepID=A0A1R3RJR6_ASPC5|nr:hypothetical protein ASPCADRAFT_131324 [Aspergillus carbonarius ITEM 5010]
MASYSAQPWWSLHFKSTQRAVMVLTRGIGSRHKNDGSHCPLTMVTSGGATERDGPAPPSTSSASQQRSRHPLLALPVTIGTQKNLHFSTPDWPWSRSSLSILRIAIVQGLTRQGSRTTRRICLTPIRSTLLSYVRGGQTLQGARWPTRGHRVARFPADTRLLFYDARFYTR